MSLSYFAENNTGNEQLWITDGTTAGTHVVKVFAGAGIAQLTMIGARVYFVVDDGVHGQELWTSDGTAAGTVLVSDIVPGAGASFPQLLANDNGTLFFTANDGTHGFELWKSDGTAAGTVMVKDMNPGAGGGFVVVETFDQHQRHAVLYRYRRYQWPRAVEERRHCRRHRHGQGHQSGRRRFHTAAADQRQRHAVLQRQRRYQRPRAVEERRHGRRHRHGQGHQSGPASAPGQRF